MIQLNRDLFDPHELQAWRGVTVETASGLSYAIHDVDLVNGQVFLTMSRTPTTVFRTSFVGFYRVHELPSAIKRASINLGPLRFTVEYRRQIGRARK